MTSNPNVAATITDSDKRRAARFLTDWAKHDGRISSPADIIREATELERPIVVDVLIHVLGWSLDDERLMQRPDVWKAQKDLGWTDEFTHGAYILETYKTHRRAARSRAIRELEALEDAEEDLVNGHLDASDINDKWIAERAGLCTPAKA